MSTIFNRTKASGFFVLVLSALSGCGGGAGSSLPLAGSLPLAPSGPPGPAAITTASQTRTALAAQTQSAAVTAGMQTAAGTAGAQTTALPVYAAAVMASGPLAYYQLADTSTVLTDSGSKHINGTYGSSVSRMAPSITAGASDAASFPGGTAYNANGFAWTPVSPSLEPTTVSVEAWIELKSNVAAYTYTPVTVYGNRGTTYGLYIQGKPNGVNTLFYQQTNVGSAGRLLFHGLTHLRPGTIYHVVSTFNGANVATYINGLLDDQVTDSGSVSYTSKFSVGLQIGGVLGSGYASFPGTIAQVAVYGSALSQSTVLAHYLAGQRPMNLTEVATPADTFVNSIGINTHFNNPASLYSTRFPTVESLLVASGIRHFRDNISTGTAFVAGVKALAAQNIHGSYAINPGDTLASVEAYPAIVSPSLEMLEPPNEQDDQGVADWAPGCIGYQQQLYKTLKKDPATAQIPILGPGLAYVSHYAMLGDLQASMDYGNFHDYMGAYNPGFPGGPYGGIKAMVAYEQPASRSKPVISTESGYGTLVQTPGLDYRTDLRYMTRLFFEQFSAGITRSYSYELIDEGTTEYPFATFGLISNTLAPKPAYYGVKSLIGALSDPGAAFTPATLSYSLSGLSTVHHLLMQKRNGAFILAIWQEVPSWNALSGGDIAVATQSVTLTTANPVAAASLATMGEDGTFATSALTWANGQTTIPVTDKVSLVTLTP